MAHPRPDGARCLRWQEGGLGLPARVEEATKDYRASMDVPGGIVGDRCVVRPGLRVTVKDPHAECGRWCKADGRTPAGVLAAATSGQAGAD